MEMFVVWLIIVIVLAAIEISTVNLVTIWFVASGILALIASFFISSVLIQFAIFVIIGVILLATTRKLAVDVLKKKGSVATNTDRVIGMEGLVTEEITKLTLGEVKVDGKRWTAVADSKIAVDKKIKVLSIEGVKLRVKEEER